MTRPSVILIVVDTLRADYLGCYGDHGKISEHIDAFAYSGVRFARTYSASNFTAPALVSLFTSLYPAAHGVYDFRIRRLPPSALMTAVRENGYYRKAVVDFGFFKSFLGESFDHMESLTDLTVNWSTEGPVVETRRALEWIGEHKDEPFFLFFHISPPHVPYRFPGRYYEIVTKAEDWAKRTAMLRAHDVLGALLPAPDGDRIPESEIERFNRAAHRIGEIDVDEAHASVIRDLYRMEVRVTDEMVGLLTRGLERVGVLDRTIVSLSSDHGEELWDHGSFSHGASTMHNEVVRTPWIVRCPQSIATPGVVERNVSHTNILPTLLDLAGIALTPEIKAKSVAGLFPGGGRGEVAGAERGGPPVFCETSRRVSVIDGRFKLLAPSRRVRFATKGEKLRHTLSRAKKKITGKTRGEIELYDLDADPGERVNLAGSERATVRRLSRLVREHYASPGAPPAGGDRLSPGEEERIKKELEGLGYY